VGYSIIIGVPDIGSIKGREEVLAVKSKRKKQAVELPLVN
jgi:hypothetical protein